MKAAKAVFTGLIYGPGAMTGTYTTAGFGYDSVNLVIDY